METSKNYYLIINDLKEQIVQSIVSRLETSTLELNDGWFALHHKDGKGYGVSLEPYDSCPVITQVNSHGMVIIEDDGDEFNAPCNQNERGLLEFDVEILVQILEVVEDNQK